MAVLSETRGRRQSRSHISQLFAFSICFHEFVVVAACVGQLADVPLLNSTVTTQRHLEVPLGAGRNWRERPQVVTRLLNAENKRTKSWKACRDPECLRSELDFTLTKQAHKNGNRIAALEPEYLPNHQKLWSGNRDRRNQIWYPFVDLLKGYRNISEGFLL